MIGAIGQAKKPAAPASGEKATPGAAADVKAKPDAQVAHAS